MYRYAFMDYMNFSLPQLRELAKSLKVPHYSTMRKPQLLAAVWEILGPPASNTKETAQTKQPEEEKEREQQPEARENRQQSEAKQQQETEAAAYAEKNRQGAHYTSAKSARRSNANGNNGNNAGQPARQNHARTGRNGKHYAAEQREAQPVKPANTENVQKAPAVQEEPAPVKSIPDNVQQLIGSRAAQYAQEAMDTNGKLGMTVERLYELASGDAADGILEVMPEGYGFIRCDNFLPGERDVYVSYQQIKRFNLKTGDFIRGGTRVRISADDKSNKFAPLLFIDTVNGCTTEEVKNRPDFEKLTPVYPNERICLAAPGSPLSMRIMDLLSPIGKGQRGMIVSPPKAGKTTLLKQIAKSVTDTNPDMTLIVLLIDERPEEVTDIKEAIELPGSNAQVIYSTFDELPEHHKRVAEMVLGRAKRLVEHGKDVMILLDSITRLARAYNLTVTPSGRTLSGGLDPSALYAPKRFFGAARNMRQGGSLTILATALVETGSRMDDVIFEEFKGTGNMELVLNRKLSEKRVFPAIDIAKSGTRNDNLLLTPQEQDAMDYVRKNLSGLKGEEAAEHVVDLFAHTKNNEDFIGTVKKTRLI